MIGILSYIKKDIHMPGRWYTKKSYIAPCDPNTDSVTNMHACMFNAAGPCMH